MFKKHNTNIEQDRLVTRVMFGYEKVHNRLKIFPVLTSTVEVNR